MDGVFFYEEFGTKRQKRLGISQGNVVAVFVCNGTYYSSGTLCYEGVGGVPMPPYPNSPVAGTCIALDYLQETCKRISEEKARCIHPALFEYLDPAPAMPHDLRIGERVKWLKEHRPEYMDEQEFKRWCKEQIATERMTRGKLLQALKKCGDCPGVPYTSYDEKRGMGSSVPLDEKLSLP